ncbi:MAG TPA: co-chaperone GroES [Gammaproteobacteria bacterium]|nr:co-chaperone GroES [Gammaproteobacteria bacterium]
MSKITPKIRLLADRVAVEAKEMETKTAGGIVLPETADKDKPMEGIVAFAGNGKYLDGKLQPLQIKVGDKVLFGKYAGTNIKIGEKEYLVMREEDVMGVIE